MIRTAFRFTALVLGAAALLAGCERPTGMVSTQEGYRGTAMGQVANPRVVGPVLAAQKLPDPVPVLPGAEGGPLAKDQFKNVQVLGDVPVAEFTRTMLAITAWVAPQQGCNYCHVPGDDLSIDKLYTKVVARRMLQMTRHINADWKTHVAATGVTCWTCHRGAPVPANVWFTGTEPRHAGGASADARGQNHPSTLAGLTAMDADPLSPFLLGDAPIRVEGLSALPVAYKPSAIGQGSAGLRQTEQSFALMVYMSKSLGVNCTHCHNSRAFAEWDQSPLTRTTAFHGIRMARDLNNAYLTPLAPSFPKERLGPAGDVAKVGCATCHQGVAKPLNGAPLLKDHMVLAGGAAAAPAPAAPAAADAGPLGRVLFEVGKTDLGAEAKAAIDAALAALKAQPALKVALSGFADKTGDVDKNLELAKQRAFAVRDALKAAGIAEDRVQLKKPEFAIGGAEAEARRVDIVPATP